MKKKKFSLVLVTAMLFFQLFSGITVKASDDFSVRAGSAIAVDEESGKIFYDQDGETPKGIASITKTVTAYLVLSEINQQKISWDQEVPISEYAEKLSTTPDLSNVPLVRGQKYTVRDLFEAMMVQSANAAAVALAELIGGNEPAFVNHMRELVTSWGIKDATIINASGLSNVYLGEHRYPGTQENDENLMSARDVAIVAQHLIKDYPEILDTTKIKEKEFAPNSTSPAMIKTWNVLMNDGPLYKEGVDGLKTGTTDLAGACFVGTIEKDGRRVITVVLNALDQDKDEDARFVETSKLMDYALDNWSQQEVAAKGTTPTDKKTLPVADGKKDTVGLETAEPITLWLRKDMDVRQLTYKTTTTRSLLNEDKKLTAPVHKHEAIGTAEASLTQDTLGYLPTGKAPSVKLVTKQAVEKANVFERLWKKVTDLVA